MIERPIKNLEDKVKCQEVKIKNLTVVKNILIEDCHKYQQEIKRLKEELKC
ncbi:hypothetical protein M2S00_06885 [Apilactobacillus sp. TMW 2.2459]|uniref:hypothetical protein n=1 Tax=Apilactobacillus xinyiensis TaxID=2841032 RepID=UPI00200BAC7C|nr:hypothetical protein [Apilactobacillus xinyiensis]MCL0312830.1 hypothetical protein [Apilactobacillus xinyiensis]